MNNQLILDELLRLIESTGVIVRNEPLGGSGGGLCTIKNEKIFFVDTQAPAIETAIQCAQDIPKIVDIEKVYIRPETRQFILNHSENTL